MQRLVRLTVLVAIAIGTGCGDEKTGPRGSISREELNGDYECQRGLGYFAGPSGTGWYEFRSCPAYYTVTNPSRADSAETFPFTITEGDRFLRQDFPDAILRYDAATSTAFVDYADRPDEAYGAVYAVEGLVLVRRPETFDFSGDGEPDSLELYFLKKPTPAPTNSR